MPPIASVIRVGISIFCQVFMHSPNRLCFPRDAAKPLVQHSTRMQPHAPYRNELLTYLGCPRSRFWDLGKHKLKVRNQADKDSAFNHRTLAPPQVATFPP